MAARYAGHFNSHAHVERDPFHLSAKRERGDFNSHAHVERDHQKSNTTVAMLGISTHTLTWSVTSFFTSIFMNFSNFNSHAHVERD